MKDSDKVEKLREVYPGIVASALERPQETDWIRQIITYGFQLGLNMKQMYAEERAVKGNGSNIPSFEQIMSNRGQNAPQSNK